MLDTGLCHKVCQLQNLSPAQRGSDVLCCVFVVSHWRQSLQMATPKSKGVHKASHPERKK